MLALLLASALVLLARPVERLLYPLRYAGHISVCARRAGVDPSLVAAVVRAESRFRPDARSRAGAVGLMQVLPETARLVARRHGLDRFRPKMLREPEWNLLIGSLYLSELMDRYHGDVVAALAAYNAGPGVVDTWVAGKPRLTIQAIRYPETRSYVREVLWTRERFNRLYPALGADARKGTYYDQNRRYHPRDAQAPHRPDLLHRP